MLLLLHLTWYFTHSLWAIHPHFWESFYLDLFSVLRDITHNNKRKHKHIPLFLLEFEELTQRNVSNTRSILCDCCYIIESIDRLQLRAIFHLFFWITDFKASFIIFFFFFYIEMILSVISSIDISQFKWFMVAHRTENKNRN